jgi:hypothetical protein
MNAELIVFGRRVDMAQRRRRRLLVVAVYAALGVLMAVLWYFTHWRGTGVYLFWAALLACRLFLGGYYKGGLVKPFKTPRPEKWSMPSGVLELKLRVYLPAVGDEESAWRNDERELHQRDHAHYLAYQALGIAVVIPWFLASLRVLRANFFGMSAMTADQVYYALLMIALLLFLTLPQAILLWTEPDMPQG